MRDEKRALRKEQIESAAYELLQANGYADTSMLQIAKKAQASNETLYRWYGDKKGLFKSLVEANAEDIKQLLETDLSNQETPEETLKELGPKLLTLLVSPKAITLNRVAATDHTGELGRALSASGRETILPLVAEVFERLLADRGCANTHLLTMVQTYISLLVGDLQIRRVIGSQQELSHSQIKARAQNALTTINKLFLIEQLKACEG